MCVQFYVKSLFFSFKYNNEKERLFYFSFLFKYIFVVPLPITETPGTSPVTLDQTIQFEPLTSTVLVQQIQSQLGITNNNEVELEGISLENQTDDVKNAQDHESSNVENVCSSEIRKTTDESKIIDEITEDSANTLKFSSKLVEECETSSENKILSNNNDDDDECINKNNKVASESVEKKEEERKKDILEYLVTFSDSATDEEKELRRKKESEVSEKPPIPLPTYLWEDLKKAKEQGNVFNSIFTKIF